MRGSRRLLTAIGIVIAFLACMMLATASAGVQDGPISGWMTEPGIDPPSYAVAVPVDSNLNIDTVVLVCNESGNGDILISRSTLPRRALCCLLTPIQGS